MTPWPKLLQNLRATRETELLGRFPAKDVTTWLGNSPKVAFKHYAMATLDALRRAVSEATPHSAPQGTAQHDKAEKAEGLRSCRMRQQKTV